MTFEFSKLIRLARKETNFLSGGHHRNVSIRRIVDERDENTVPFACLFLGGCSHLSLTILGEIVAVENRPPIPQYYAGRVPVIVECWKYWALEQKHVAIKYDPNTYWVEDKFGN